MPGPAQVRSVEAIDAFQAALARFHHRIQTALDALDAEVYRASDWVEHDRPTHWRNQVHKAEDRVHQAKIDLERCLTFTVGNERPTCREQQAALKQAKAHLEHCREKADAVRRWQQSLRHETFEFDGRVGQLRRLLELDAPKARALLQNVIRRLDEYKIERPPEFGPASQPLVTSNAVPASLPEAAADAAANEPQDPAAPQPLEER